MTEAAKEQAPPAPPPSLQERTAVALEDLRDLLVLRERREGEERVERERRERLGRPGNTGELRKPFWLLHAMRSAPGLVNAFERRVPPEFWGVDAGGAVVSCPCGETPVTDMGHPKTCACERAYLYDGEDVRVAFSPLDQKPEPQTPAES